MCIRDSPPGVGSCEGTRVTHRARSDSDELDDPFSSKRALWITLPGGEAGEASEAGSMDNPLPRRNSSERLKHSLRLPLEDRFARRQRNTVPLRGSVAQVGQQPVLRSVDTAEHRPA